jgi:hypothetical protein
MTSFWQSIEGDLLLAEAARVVTLTNLYQKFGWVPHEEVE